MFHVKHSQNLNHWQIRISNAFLLIYVRYNYTYYIALFITSYNIGVYSIFLSDLRN